MKLAETKTDVSRGTYSDDKSMTVSAWAEKWLDVYKADKSYSTLHGYKNVIKNHINDIMDVRLKDLTKADVQLCINKASGHWDIQRRIKNTLIQMLDCAIDDGLLYKNVATKTTVPRKPKTNTRKLTTAEKNAINHCDLTLEEKAFIYILWYAGLRPEEARALTKNDIDLRRKEINVNKALSFESNKSVIGPPKTDAGYRTVPILDTLFSILSDYLGENDNLYLFTKTDGNLHTRTTYRTFFKKIFNKINSYMGGNNNFKATDLHPYVFRHEYATILYYSGIDIKQAAKLMGHADIKMILEVYAELDDNSATISEKLNRFIAQN